MKSTSNNLKDEFSVIVCLYAEYPGYTNLLRKYFASYNCRIYLNNFTINSPHYRIVIGNSKYVKSIAERKSFWPRKTCYIVISSSPETANFKLPENSKLVIVDKPFSGEETLQKVMSFFFLGNTRQLVLRSDGKDFTSGLSKVTQKKLPDQLSNQSNMPYLQKTTREPVHHSGFNQSNSEKRISQIMKEIYFQDKPLKNKRLAVLRIVTFIVSLPFILYVMTLSAATISTIVSYRIFSGSQHQAASGFIRIAGAGTKVADFILSPCQYFARGLCLPQLRYISVLKKINSIFSDAIELQNTVSRVMAPEPGENNEAILAAALDSVKNDLPQLKNELSLVRSELNLLTVNGGSLFSFSPVREYILDVTRKISRYELSLNIVSDLLTLYRQAAGFDKKRQYLILLQNSQEIRPTGGFIGSTAVVSFTGGRLSDLKIIDVYDLDGQLKGHVDPPAAMRDLLGLEHWYLRDSNWDPDFRVSGEKAQWFYETVTGDRLDGVIAVSSLLLSDILEVLGPVYVPDFNITVDSANIHETFRTLVDEQFFPGSNQKKNLLSSLFSLLINKAISAPGGLGKIAGVLLPALENRLILLRFTDPKLQTVTGLHGWDGRFPPLTGACEGDSVSACYANTVAFVDANLTSNKADAFIERKAAVSLTKGDLGELRQLTAITYTHTGKATATGGTALKNYHRVYLSPGASGVTVTLDELAVPFIDEATTSALPYAQLIADSSHTVIGVAFIVPEHASRLLTVSAIIRTASESAGLRLLDTGISYQAGVRDIPFEFTAGPAADPGFFIPSGQTGFVANDGRLKYNNLLTGSERIRIGVKEKESL